MKVAALSESSADEAAIQILVGGILGREAEPVSSFPLRTRGWPSVAQVLPSVIRHLHYRTDAEALVVVVDANHSPLHREARDQEGVCADDCRFCRLHGIARRVKQDLAVLATKDPLKVAIGIAAPAIEAWYRVGVDPTISEASVIQALTLQTSLSLKRRLKRDVYGTDIPSLAMEMDRATAEARRLVQNLNALEEAFPNGFGLLARSVRFW